MTFASRRGFRAAARGAAFVLAALCGLAIFPAGSEDAFRTQLERENERLRRQVELGAETAHLVLDLAGRRLRLMAGGAVLRDYPIVSAELGMPQRLFLSARGSSVDWRAPIRTGAKLDPHKTIGRIEMVPSGSPDEPLDIPVPAEPEEALPAPDRFVLRYDDGFTIEVRSATAAERPGGFWGSLVSSLGNRLADAAEIAQGASAPRLRIVLSAADAGALYRSFPTESKLLVL